MRKVSRSNTEHSKLPMSSVSVSLCHLWFIKLGMFQCLCVCGWLLLAVSCKANHPRSRTSKSGTFPMCYTVFPPKKEMAAFFRLTIHSFLSRSEANKPRDTAHLCAANKPRPASERNKPASRKPHTGHTRARIENKPQTANQQKKKKQKEKNKILFIK